MNCINIKHKDFINLQEATELPALILELQVAEWQRVNNTDAIPTESQLRGVSVDTLVQYNNSADLQLIGSKEEFTSFVNNQGPVSEITSEVLDRFEDYALSLETYDLDFNMDDVFDKTTYEKVKVDDSVPEIFGDYVSHEIERQHSHNTSTLFGTGTTDVKSVLDVIIAKAEMTPEANTIMSKAIKLGGDVKVKVTKTLGNRLVAFNPATGEIEVNTDILGEFNTTQVAQAFLHEVAHVRSLNALLNPRTAEEKAFRDLMTEFFNTHNELSDSYGFQSVEEMVAEIYANPEFRSEIQAIPATDEKKGIWSKIIDAIRRLFGVAKTPHNQAIINEVVNFVENNNMDFDVIQDSPLYFAPNRFDKITNLEDRVKLLNDRVLDNIDQLVKLNKSSSIVTSNITVEERAKRIEELQALLEVKDLTKDILGIANYIKLASDVAVSLEKDFIKRINDFEKDNKGEIMDAASAGLHKIEKHMALYNLNTDVYGVLRDKATEMQDYINMMISADPLMDPDLLPETAMIREIHLLMDEVNLLIGRKRGVDNVIKAYRQKYAAVMLSRMVGLIPQVETDLKEEIGREYRQKVKAGEDVQKMTEKEYINHMISTRDRELLDQRRNETAHDLVYSEFHEDISTFDLNWQDPLNIDNSPLIGATVNLISQMRIRTLKKVRISNREIAKIEREFSAIKNGKPSEKFKNMLEQDEDGNYYLKGEYSIKYYNDYNKIYNKVVRKLMNIVDKVKVTSAEIDSFNGEDSTHIFRTQGDTSFVKNQRINLTTTDNFTKLNARVADVTNYDNVNDIDTTILNNMLAVYGFTSLEQFNKSSSSLKTSQFAKKNPELYAFLKENGSIKAVHLIKIKTDESTKKDAFRDEEFRAWSRENTVKKGSDFLPAPKYKNDLSGLTKEELAALDKFKEISGLIESGSKSLRKSIGGVSTNFYKLPSRNKTQREYILEGKVKDTVKAMGRDFTNVEKEDINYGQRLDPKGQVLQSVKLHFRGNMEADQQSLDLFTLYRDEAANVIAYQEKVATIPRLNAIKEVSANKRYLAKSSASGKFIKNVFSKRVKEETFEGIESNEFKKIAGLIEANIFDVKNYSSGKLGSADISKLTNTINGTVATVGLTFNYVSGIANVTNGFTQMFIDSVGGRHFSATDLALAEKDYLSEVGEIASDFGHPNKQARVNQIMEMFDVLGGLNPETQSYLQNTVAKRLASRKSLGFMQDMGEHAMAGILTYAIMRGIKVTNSNGLFVDKEGNVTTEDKAASLFDMIQRNEDGSYGFSDKFFSTSHAPTAAFAGSGQSQVSLLIKKRMHDMFGAYDEGLQPEVYKHVWGKTVLMFKRFLLPGMIYRYKGFSTSFKDPSKLTNADRAYNFAAKQYEEGYYTTLVRFLIHGIGSSARQLNFEVLRNYRTNMTDLERRNLRKAFLDVSLTAMLLPVLRALLLAAFDDEDEDNVALYAAVYQIRRLEMEMAQFRNPVEATKILMNPIASARYVQNVLKATYDTATFLNLTPEEDEPVFDWLREDSEGKNVMLKQWSKVVPIWAQWGKDMQRMYTNIDK